MSNTDSTSNSSEELDMILEGFENDRRWDSLGEPANEGVGFLTLDEAKEALLVLINREKAALLDSIIETRKEFGDYVALNRVLNERSKLAKKGEG